MEGASNENIFCGVKDKHKGVTIDSNKEPCNILEFPGKLEGNLELFKCIHYILYLLQAYFIIIQF